MGNKYKIKNTCRLCKSEQLGTVVQFDPTPPGNDFIGVDQLGAFQEKYPLAVKHCNTCHHNQLNIVVDPKLLYQRNYKYISGIGSSFLKHFSDYAKWCKSSLRLSKNDRVLDIGSNDGSCLAEFKKVIGCEVLGVDPAENIARMANEAGIETIPGFFSATLANEIAKSFGRKSFKLVTSHNVLAHIDNLDDVLQGVSVLLSDDGFFIFEVGYAVDVVENLYFDTIYHEHLDYHTVTPLIKYLQKFNLQVVDALKVTPQGGSIRIISRPYDPNKNYDISDRLRDILNMENLMGFNSSEPWIEFEKRLQKLKLNLNHLLNELKKDGKKICAYGAPTKSTSFLNFFKITKKQIEFIVDDNPLKQGLFAPVTEIPILTPDEILKSKADYVLILAWNFADDIVRNNQELRDSQIKFIVPMPELRII